MTGLIDHFEMLDNGPLEFGGWKITTTVTRNDLRCLQCKEYDDELVSSILLIYLPTYLFTTQTNANPCITCSTKELSKGGVFPCSIKNKIRRLECHQPHWTCASLFFPNVLGLSGVSSSLISPSNSNSSASLNCLDSVFLVCPFTRGNRSGRSMSLGGTGGLVFTA